MSDGATGDLKDKGKLNPTPHRIRLRAILLGLLMIYVAGQWIFEGEMVRYSFTTWAAPFYVAVFILFCLIGLNAICSRLFKRVLLNNLELLCIYSMVSVASALLSTDLLGILFTVIGYPTHFANPANEWARLFVGALPQWLMVTDKKALVNFYEGHSTLYNSRNMQAWLTPCLYWSIFIAALFFAFLSLTSLLRKHWVESERLTFPIVQLPLAMTEHRSQFFRDRLMWIGFAVAGGITLLNGIHVLAPNVPQILIRRQPYYIFSTPPWDAIPYLMVAFYFFGITLGFLMPLDLSFSLWFFFFIYLAERVVCRGLGYEPNQTLFTTDQAFGAFSTIGISVLLGARRHLVAALRCAWRPDGMDAEEPFSYRSTFVVLGISILVMFCFLMAAGASAVVTFGFILIIMMLALVISRIRAELGFPVHDLQAMGPNAVLTRLFGTVGMSKASLGMLTVTYWAERAHRSHPAPHMIESAKLAAGSKLAGRDMLRAITLAGIVAIPLSFIIYLEGFYRLGVATAKINLGGVGYGAEAFSKLEIWMRAPEPVQAGHWVGMLVGILISGVLILVRGRVIGFPLHPLGFAVYSSWGVWQLWLPILIGSIAKAVALKVGGLKTYRKATMFFFGLMLGELVIGCLWQLVGMAFQVRTYDFWP